MHDEFDRVIPCTRLQAFRPSTVPRMPVFPGQLTVLRIYQ